MNELHLFAGAGGGILGGILLGHTCVCAVEIEPYCRKVLFQRQRDGILPKFPIWDDVRTFDGIPWRGTVDIICGGFPCQDISAGNPRAEGINGARSGLWSDMARIISEIRPTIVFVENSPMLAFRGLGRVVGDLAALGYDSRWGMFRASMVGLEHHRQRIFIYADNHKDPNFRTRFTNLKRTSERSGIGLRGKNRKEWEQWSNNLVSLDVCERPASYTEGRRVFYGMANAMDRYAAIGNGQVPAVVKLAWDCLSTGRISSNGVGVSNQKDVAPPVIEH